MKISLSSCVMSSVASLMRYYFLSTAQSIECYLKGFLHLGSCDVIFLL